MNYAHATHRITACASCDALLHIPHAGNSTFHCVRCGLPVHHVRPAKLESALALWLAAAIFFVMANTFPIVAIDSGGESARATLLGATLALHDQGMNSVALIVLGTTFLIPAVELICSIGLLALAELRRDAATIGLLFRIRERYRPWGMTEIFLLGTLIGIVKLGSLASVVLGAGLLSLACFIFLNAAGSHAFDTAEFWRRLEARS